MSESVQSMCRVGLTSGITLNRLEEICTAEREGRVAILPCKVGDAAYTASKGKIKEYPDTSFEIWKDSTGRIRVEMRAQISAMAKEYITHHLGKTWWLTRAEVEAAVEEKRHENT